MKRKIKQAVTIALSLAIALSLCACGGGSPSAQELAGKLSATDLSGYYDMGVSVAGNLSEDDISGNVSLKADVESDGTVTHITDMSMSFSMAGLSMELGAEAWTDQGSGAAYMNMRLFGEDTGWVRSDLDGVDSSMIGIDPAMADMSLFAPDGTSEPVLRSHKSGEDYIIDYTISAGAMNGLMDSMLDEAIDDVDSRFETVSVSAVFDGKTESLKEIHITGSGDGAEVTMDLVFYSVGGDTKLSVPQDVIDTAVADDSYYGTDYDDDYVFSYDDNGLDSDSDDSIWSAGDDGYYTDNDGYDDVIDPMAKAAAAKCGDDETIVVSHYTDYAEMSIRHTDPGENGWSGEIGIRNVFDDSYGGAEGYYISEREFLDGWHSADNLVENTGTMFLYIRNNDELDMCRIDGDMLISISIYTYQECDRAFFDDCITYLSNLAGV